MKEEERSRFDEGGDKPAIEQKEDRFSRLPQTRAQQRLRLFV